ncbi:GNAT-family acetyltransferase (TIGR03103 family) [Roseibium hamelinense]|uniref:GNAT-family acetyltransferase (TIGR03103 family) n=1 Tax=Roseibium hamelinense TaxID=150831 RepID=A0A562TGZ0_9HYPH|nr:N-acetylglutaminylglutamine synthetase [Roseibium hamelinense]MTI45950.1 N-acetylglutaminylglutamine synthetase [Roseibium hamelinense]TWI92865.1 GNAT-family acetyltransferase (TIGR03103 family) [Roseibium hamelinense]
MSDNQAPKRQKAVGHRLKRMREHGMKPEYRGEESENQRNQIVNCGWGRLIFGNTFAATDSLVEVLREEQPDRRDIAIYVRDPHVVVGMAPQELFLDPSHTYRLNLATYRPARNRRKGFTIRRLSSRSDAEAINALYASRGMVPIPLEFFWSELDPRMITVLVAEEDETGTIVGTAMGIDHERATNGADMGSSLWCLSVSAQARFPGIGEALVRRLSEVFKARGNPHMDLSVMHDNTQAIALYEKIGFERVPFFTVKRKNMINESLFAGPAVEETLNPYATIIVNEARRRGIQAEIIDAEGGFFRLSYGGRSVRCRESLSEFTSAVAMSICDDKATTQRIVSAAGISVPDQITADQGDLVAFLEQHGSVVVKPARGEQGKGIAIGLKTVAEIENAIEVARNYSNEVLIEQCVTGQDLRLVVIDYKVVAAAVRRPAEIMGNGRSTIKELIETQSRRRSSATGGESKILIDAEAHRCLNEAGYGLDAILEDGKPLAVRRTANLHTGGTIHDVTGETHHTLIEAAIRAAKAIGIPVTGIDLMVKDPREPDYAFIEANERPGLANHEPQPTAERFVDFLFPLSLPQSVRDTMNREYS